jgi:hypothetical protein
MRGTRSTGIRSAGSTGACSSRAVSAYRHVLFAHLLKRGAHAVIAGTARRTGGSSCWSACRTCWSGLRLGLSLGLGLCLALGGLLAALVGSAALGTRAILAAPGRLGGLRAVTVLASSGGMLGLARRGSRYGPALRRIGSILADRCKIELGGCARDSRGSLPVFVLEGLGLGAQVMGLRFHAAHHIVDAAVHLGDLPVEVGLLPHARVQGSNHAAELCVELPQLVYRVQ